ncbi:MAG TPA: DUF3999 family protein, partial [Vicinamibacterales bacterium]|nr:DUF3999 family protein [Vicinamibacterales bacterium]
MTRAAVFVVAIVVALSSAVPRAQQTTAFRVERPITLGESGPHRLAVDVPLLAGASPYRNGLHDLRIYDSGGREVGYLFVANPPAPPRFKGAAILPIAPVDTDRLRTSGFEADLGAPLVVDGFRLDGLPPPYLKRVRLEGSGDREHWTLLNEGTVFDLPQEQLRLGELRFRPGPYRFLRATFDDTNSQRLPHPLAASARLSVGAPPPPPLTAPLVFERRNAEPGRSRFRIRLPGGHLPIAALDLDVGGSYVFRPARVFEARFSGSELAPVQLGGAMLRRVVRDDAEATALRLPIDRPAEAQLDLEVDDGDNPPLELKGVTAVFSELPWIYLDAAAGTLTARYGNDSLTPPRYDIEAARSQIRIESVADAKWGEPRARSAEENAASGAAPPMPTLGAPLDAGLFKYLRDLPPGGSGLIVVPLDVAVLAHSAGATAGFPDLRAIDASGSQVPYVLERAAEPLTLELTPERLAAPPKTLPALPANASPRSVYRIRYPYPNLPTTSLSIATDARVFDRGIIVGVERDVDRSIGDGAAARRRDPAFEVLAATRWVHADQDRPARPLTVQIPPLRTTDVYVVVDEGDNSPLPIGTAHIMLPASRIRF